MVGFHKHHAEHARQRRAKLEAEKLTPEEKARWERMMLRTWNAIADDAAAIEDEGGKLTPAVIVEIVLDAGRVQQYGGMTEEEYEFLGTQYHKRSFQKWARRVLNY